MLMAESEKMDLEVNEFSLIDFSLENDNLIGNSSSPLPSWGLEEYPSSGVTDIQDGMDMACKGNNHEQFPQLHESKEPEKARRKGKVNLRKSLAWDSAFFTDAGVLDADELSCMIKGGDKQTLPMIEEDVRQSVDSISTLESDNLTLDRIEAELFEDIRASIQKVTIPTSGDVSAKIDNGANSSAKKEDFASKDRLKPKLAPKRIIGAQAGIPKSQPKQITGTQRLGKGLNQDKAQVTKSISRTTSGASLKPPKISTKLQPVSVSKRASLDITRIKTDNDSMKISTASVRGAQTPKTSALNKASRVLPKPTMSMKPSSVGSSPAMKVHLTRSSSESSGSTSSNKIAKSSIPVARRKLDSSKPIAQPSASAKLKTPSKLPSGNSAISAYLMSSKINASISPASSISEWSSVSSSSSATINQGSSKLRTSFDTNSCRSFDSDNSTLDLNNHLSDQKSDKPEIRGTTFTRESLKQAGSVSRPASMIKPSGLRMPSPKMGYFDGVKSIRTPNGTHSISSTVLPKSEATICSPKVNSNTKAKSVKVPLRANRKPETLKHLSPLSSSDESNISDNHSGAQSSLATGLPKTEATICSPKGNSSTKAKSVRVPLRANRKPETLKHLSPVSSSDKSNVSDNHTGGPSDITRIPDLLLDVHHEISGANTSRNMDVLAEEPDLFGHIQSASPVASSVATKGENQGIASALDNKEDVAQGLRSVEHVADDRLVAIKSENQVIVNNDTHEIKSENQMIANTSNNEEVVAEEPEAVEHVADDGLVAIKSENHVIVNNDTHKIKSENQIIANTLNNEEVVAEEPEAVEQVAGDDLVAIESENEVFVKNDIFMSERRSIASALNNEEIVAEGPATDEVIVKNDTNVIKSEHQRMEEAVANEPDTVEHVAGDGLAAIKNENQVIVKNDTDVLKSEHQRVEGVVADEPSTVEHVPSHVINTEHQRMEEAVANEPDTVEHIAGAGLVAIKSENQVIVNNDTDVIKGEHQRVEEVVADEPDTVEHIPSDVINSGYQRIEEAVANEPDIVEHVTGDGLVANKSENQVIVNNDTDVIKSEHQRVEEVVADEPSTVEHAPSDDLVAMKSENQVITNNDIVIIKSESQGVESTSNNKDFVAEGPDTVEDVPGEGLIAIERENQCVLDNDTAVGSAAIRCQKQGVMENEMNLDSTENMENGMNLDIIDNMENEMELDTIENIDIKAVEVTIGESTKRCQTDLDMPSQVNEMNLVDNVNGDFKHIKNDQVETEYDPTFRGAETMPQCQTGNEGRVDVKDDLNTPEKTNAKKNVCTNQADQLNSQVEEVSITPFKNKVESLINKLAYLSLNTPEVAVRRMPLAVKNSSCDCLDFCDEAAQAVGKTDLDLPSLQIDHKENNNL